MKKSLAEAAQTVLDANRIDLQQSEDSEQETTPVRPTSKKHVDDRGILTFGGPREPLQSSNVPGWHSKRNSITVSDKPILKPSRPINNRVLTGNTSKRRSERQAARKLSPAQNSPLIDLVNENIEEFEMNLNSSSDHELIVHRNKKQKIDSSTPATRKFACTKLGLFLTKMVSHGPQDSNIYKIGTIYRHAGVLAFHNYMCVY